ncbi:hypothetical protein PPL_03302 [Heterostelium album PN500]|uniref:Peptidase C39-like domain-containing protein n=1 Tax=Heterostelium pallidum (strain ATCC 26659 / Pp 5 / PN500) TaxID=670386 RepID=D3B4H7_HETP5|nr:hypothetical protein PPL_03302 [Heterostelium album PN500]EFA84225.1 hypothetical protein PPL_03302 [Heterostelium album PN500]|eukprot:XP_020436341.1 hypothetical protein PPL_03302 [Heterostelium album PN500]
MKNPIVFIILLAGIYSWYSCYAYAIPSEYLIKTVPYHRQVTDYNCGDASLQMVFGYYGQDINQEQIDDVARTSKHEGTSSYDIVRTAQFSILSQSQGTDKKKKELNHGFPNYPYGLNAVGYSSNEEWMDGLKSAISLNIPIIVLMHYSLEDPGGHFRVVIGYNDDLETITTLDPWDRDGQPQVYTLSYSNFTALWNYTEKDSPRGTPFFGVAIWPLNVDIVAFSNGNQTTFNVKFDYTNPIPFLSELQLLPKTLGTITNFIAPKDSQFVSASSYTTGPINEGDTVKSLFVVNCPGGSCHGLFIANVEILIQASVPYTYDRNHYYYPPYSYIDVIGYSEEAKI